MITAIIQARVNSTRLRNKIFLPLSSKPLLWHVVNRLKSSERIQKILIATTINPDDNIIEDWAKDNGIDVFRGSEQDVLSRYYYAAEKIRADTIVRVTSDDPFKDPFLIDTVIELFEKSQLDFAYNNYPPSFPEGLDIEVFSFKALEKAQFESTDSYEREHVTQYFYRHPELFKQLNHLNNQDLSYLRWTLDTQTDYDMVQTVYNNLYKPIGLFTTKDILQLIQKNPEIGLMNINEKRSGMYTK